MTQTRIGVALRYSEHLIHATHGDAVYHILEIDADQVDFFVSPQLQSRKYVPDFLEAFNLDAAINGDGFISTKITGFAASEGKPYGQQGVEGTVYISKDNKFSEVRPPAKDLWNAISYPNRLVKDGEVVKINKSINDVRARTAWGYTQDQKTVYMIAVDGGDYLSQSGLNFPEVAHILLDLGCYQAFMQDGGGSTTMGVRAFEPGWVINRPSGEDLVSGYAYPMRRVANVLGVRAKSQTEIAPPTGETMSDQFRVIEPVKSRKTPSMFETVTKGNHPVGHTFVSSYSETWTETIQGVKHSITWRQNDADKYYYPMVYKGTAFLVQVGGDPEPEPEPTPTRVPVAMTLHYDTGPDEEYDVVPKA